MEMRDMAKLSEFFRRSPRKAARAMAMMVNDAAFTARGDVFSQIDRTMTLRSPGFVKSRLRVEKAPLSAPLGSAESRLGMIETERFGGLVAQQRGVGEERGRVATLLARGNSEAKRVRPSARMRPGETFEDQDDYPGSGDKQAVIMLSKLRRRRHRRPFIIRDHRKIKPGLFKFAGRGQKDLRKLQSLEPPKKTHTNRWMTDGMRRWEQAYNEREAWRKALTKVWGRRIMLGRF